MDKQQQDKLIAAAKQAIATYEAAGNVAPEPDYLTLFKIALASLDTAPEAWAHRLVNKHSGTIHPWVYGSAEASPSEGDVFRIEVMKLYTAPPAPVVKLPSETVIHSEMDFIRKEKAKSRNETIAEVLRLNSSDTDSIDTTPQQYQSLS